MDYLIEFGLFSGKTLIITIAIIVVLAVLAGLVARGKQARQQHLEIEHLNDKYKSFTNSLKRATFSGKHLKEEIKLQKKEQKLKKKKGSKKAKNKVFVLDFHGDIRAAQVETFRDEVTAALSIAEPESDEVVVRVESTGGMVHTYGLAASQLQRIRDHKVNLTVCVDKVAASGGYMMACTSDQILAAPFAIIGSIGVIAQVPNIHRVLKKHDVDYEEITAGEFKRTISLMGEITEKGREKFLEQIEDTHVLFKDYVKKNRPQLDINKVATGEYWYGERAKALNLVDQLMTSDEYLFARRETHELYKLRVTPKKKLGEKLSEALSNSIHKSLLRAWQSLYESSLFTR